ncbi:hypothetical protein GT034_00855 [Streptomyces sp. SID2563]|uniref:hypothetical protein n=1 Tax=Streptomyces sp. SID2563 TaxID=2690255 RepID=UPI001371BC95|nr:hypothetical protein [Streptomyces sp. SID2563]MYW06918.1 hypothetical protein [Streptomyces sp. SID2563]
MQEAADRADRILDETFSGIKPPVEWVHGESTEGSCDVSRRRAVTTVISEERRGSFLGVVERQWQKAGYRRVGVNASAQSPATYFETLDRFRVRLLIGGRGQAFFEVATPCVDRSSVSKPTPRAGGDEHVGEPVPAPNVRDGFWSGGAP